MSIDMRVTVTQRLFANPNVFRLSDYHLVWGDLVIARDNFESTLNKIRLPDRERNHPYSLACSGLIHYRRAFDRSGHRRAFLTEKVVRRFASEYFLLHRHLMALANKYVAHSENEYEQCLVTVLVAQDEEGNSTFRGLGMQATAIAMLSEDDTQRAIKLIDQIIECFLLPEIKRLEEVVRAVCVSMSPEQLKNLPDGLAPASSSDPQKKRSWPHSGTY